MRGLTRLGSPNILTTRHQQWTDDFVASVRKRPDNNKYGHVEIKTALNAMSFHKCFYCERKLKGISKEIDHFIEVSERRDLAYEWTNLHLACDNCNGKIPNSSIPVDMVLNPVGTTDQVIEMNLTFDEEIILSRGNSALGQRTIQKFKLDSELLDHQRCKRLKEFFKILSELNGRRAEENRDYTADELALLRSFRNNDNSFSLMFKVLLSKLGF